MKISMIDPGRPRPSGPVLSPECNFVGDPSGLQIQLARRIKIGSAATRSSLIGGGERPEPCFRENATDHEQAEERSWPLEWHAGQVDFCGVGSSLEANSDRRHEYLVERMADLWALGAHCHALLPQTAIDLKGGRTYYRPGGIEISSRRLRHIASIRSRH